MDLLCLCERSSFGLPVEERTVVEADAGSPSTLHSTEYEGYN
jgi:hypothetical protein